MPVIRKTDSLPPKSNNKNENGKDKGSRLQKAKRFAKRFFAQFGTAIISVAVVSYVFLQLMLNVGALIDVENASYAKVKDAQELNAYIFRNEILIPSGGSGTDCYLVPDGEKVQINSPVVITYSDPSDAQAQAKINEIDKRITILEKSSLSSGEVTTSISKLDDEIDRLMLSMLKNVDRNSMSKVLREQEELLILMNRRQALVQSHSFSAELKKLYAEKEALKESQTGSFFTSTASESGYFYSSVDGYEDFFTKDALKNLTVDKFMELSESVPNKNIVESSSGKLVLGSEWYAAVGIGKREASYYDVGEICEITFQYSNNMKLKMELRKKITKTDSDTAVLVFSTKTMPESFDYSRRQTVELPVREYEGIKVPASSIRVNDGVTGVYTVLGSRVLFKKAEIIHEYGNYVICEIPKNPAYPNRHDVAYSSKEYLSLHDAVIVAGENIYDGKVLT